MGRKGGSKSYARRTKRYSSVFSFVLMVAIL